jgi:serine/threonine-protein kinase
MNFTKRCWVISSVVAALVAGSGAASAADEATATVLFNDAKRLVTAGKYAEACPKFEESQRLDPGIGTQFNLADCYEHVGRSAAAWALFQDVAASSRAAGQAPRAKVADQRAAALEPKLSKLTIVAPKDVTGLEVRRNGELLGGVLWGNAIPVDPGSYTIEASAPGRKKWSSVTTVGPNAAQVTVTIPELAVADAPPAPAPAVVAPAASPAQASPSPDADTHSRGQTQRTVALITAGAGLVGVAVGSVFGVESFSKHSTYTSECQGTQCTAAGVSDHDSAVSAGNVSTIAFVAGGALVAVGGVLWFTAPKGAPASTAVRVTPLVGSATAGLSLGGGW